MQQLRARRGYQLPEPAQCMTTAHLLALLPPRPPAPPGAAVSAMPTDAGTADAIGRPSPPMPRPTDAQE